MTDQSEHTLLPQYTQSYVFGGRAKVTFKSAKTGNQVTITVSQDKKYPTKYFVYKGEINETGYIHLGFVYLRDGNCTFSPNSKLCTPESMQLVRNVQYCLIYMHTDPNVITYHLGRCSVCGRELTDPESIERVIGPTCLSNNGG